jgi:hypothetical protein
MKLKTPRTLLSAVTVPGPRFNSYRHDNGFQLLFVFDVRAGGSWACSAMGQQQVRTGDSTCRCAPNSNFAATEVLTTCRWGEPRANWRSHVIVPQKGTAERWRSGSLRGKVWAFAR